MTKAERRAYELQLRGVAKRLGIPLRGATEDAIIHHCKSEVEKWILAHGQQQTLTDLLQLVTGSLNLDVAEIRDDRDLEQLLRRIPPDQEPAMARLQTELDDQTDAITLQRRYHRSWERPYLAVINCRGWHVFRKYFSKWHEVVHLLLDGKQLSFAFRRTTVMRREPEEMLVDRVAAVLAFYPDIFDPVFQEELKSAGQLTFDVVDRVRHRVAPEASRHATLLACLRHCPHPVYFVQVGMGYKRGEEQSLTHPQAEFFPNEVPRPQPKLRVREAAASPAVEHLGIRVHKNMEVPPSSVVASAFEDPFSLPHIGCESLHAWRTSASGPIGYGEVDVEAVRLDEQVWALLRFRQEAKASTRNRTKQLSI